MMDPRVLKRFIKNMAILIFVMFSAWAVWGMYTDEKPGDYATREGDIRLSERNFEEALSSFNRALRDRPNHRGALMGRALVFIQTKQYDKASAELTYLIDYLKKNLDPPTRRAPPRLRRHTPTGASSTTGRAATWRRSPIISKRSRPTRERWMGRAS